MKNYVEEAKKVKVVRDNEVKFGGLTFMVSDDEMDEIKDFVESLLSGKNVSAPTKLTAAAQKIIEKDAEEKEVEARGQKPKTRFDELNMEFENHGKKQIHFFDSGLVIINLEDGEYRARFNYKMIYNMSKDKETGKHSDRKNEYMKELFKKQIKEFGAEWIKGDSEYDFGWYKLPSKKAADEYKKARKADDKKYAKA